MNELVDKKAIIFLVGTYSFLFSCLGWLQIEVFFISPIKALGSRQKYRQLFESTRTSVASLPPFHTSTPWETASEGRRVKTVTMKSHYDCWILSISDSEANEGEKFNFLTDEFKCLFQPEAIRIQC